MKVKSKIVWECIECGHEQQKWAGSCPSCSQWNTFVEKNKFEEQKRYGSAIKKQKKPLPLSQIQLKDNFKQKTGFVEVDRLLGGGVVEGSFLLLGGSPGIGKSTLSLQLAKGFAENGKKVLYICGEESEEQTMLRAKRLGIETDHIFLLHETNLEAIKNQLVELNPEALIVDSVQILYKEQIGAAPGSIVQVREIASECMHLSKEMNMTTILIGHVTKSGDIAGPRVLEHLVDVVLEFEGERSCGYRMLRCRKNRFGSTDNIALFQMQKEGLQEVLNPSKAFLEERTHKGSGSAIVSALEGGRSLLLEVQALVTPTAFPTPSRKATGIDSSRLALLLAVLEKKMGFALHSCDVFASLAGGMRIKEPAIDLGILLAIASSFSNRVIPHDTIIMGEVGLSGEIRSIKKVQSRLQEAMQLGFEHCILPLSNMKELPDHLKESISLHPVQSVEEAIGLLV
ncbi:MAG TPA: DNA repair protein RadA [Chlamydiales bacterium]|nr:DNA repair protein RadA [Chlamydiales bacterium]